jgi:hypothetical protein
MAAGANAQRKGESCRLVDLCVVDMMAVFSGSVHLLVCFWLICWLRRR